MAEAPDRGSPVAGSPLRDRASSGGVASVAAEAAAASAKAEGSSPKVLFRLRTAAADATDESTSATSGFPRSPRAPLRPSWSAGDVLADSAAAGADAGPADSAWGGGLGAYLLQEAGLDGAAEGLAGGARGVPAEVAAFKHERVYNAVLRTPFRLERALLLGVSVCVDALADLFTLVPLRAAVWLGRGVLYGFRSPTPRQARDLAQVLIIVSISYVLTLTDVSVIYHEIRQQDVLKLYVVFQVLEVADKLCGFFGSDVLEALNLSTAQYFSPGAPAVQGAEPHRTDVTLSTVVADFVLALLAVAAHAHVLLLMSVTLNVAVNSHNKHLIALLISNNFGELKSFVFKKLDPPRLYNMVSQDAVERIHLGACLVFVAVQHMLGAGSLRRGLTPRLGLDLLIIVLAEALADVLKHSFALRFNNMKPEVYDSFRVDLCKRVGKEVLRQGSAYRMLGFVPLAATTLLVRTFADLFTLNYEEMTGDDVRDRAGMYAGCGLAAVCGKLALGWWLRCDARRIVLEQAQAAVKEHAA